MVVGTPDIDDPIESALELVAVIGDVRSDVGVFPVRLDQHSILLVAKIGGPEPDSPLVLKDVSALTQQIDRASDISALMKAGLAEPDIKRDSSQFERLLDIAHRPLQAPLPDTVPPIRYVRKGVAEVSQQLISPFRYVRTVVTVLRELCVPPETLEIERFEAGRITVHLDSSIVVVILPAYRVTGVVERPGDNIPDHSSAAMSDVERSVGIRRHEFDLDPLFALWVAPGMARTLNSGYTQHFEVPAGCEGEVDKAGPGYIDGGQVLDIGKVVDDHTGQVARTHPGLLGCSQRDIGSPIAVFAVAGPLHNERHLTKVGDKTAIGGFR